MDVLLKDTDIVALKKVFTEFPQIAKVIVFGSRALGNAKNGSDLDLAIVGNNIDSILTKLWGILENETPLPYKFDLVDYANISNSALVKHIDEKGQTIYES